MYVLNSKKLKRGGYILIGTIFLGLGIIGIFLPILPTTPFLLLATACYYKGSRRLHQWMTNNKWLGKYLKNFIERKGIPLKTKLFTIILLWISISYSALYIIHNIMVQIILFIIAITVSAHVMTLPTKR